MSPVIVFIIFLLDLYVWVLIAAVTAGWLAAFGVLNMKNPHARKVVMLLDAATEPPIRFIRRFIPPVGGIDLSPMILIFAIYIVQNLLHRLAYL
jgi:YggT family protein